MNTQIEDAVTEILTVLQAAAATGTAFAIEQMPLLIQEILAWGVAKSLFWIGFGAVMVPFAITLRVICRRHEDYNSGELVWCCATLVPAFFGFMAVAAIAINIYTLLLISYAPRIYLIREIAWMLR